MKLSGYLTDFFTKGHERSLKAKKNIVATFGIKGLSLLIGFLLVPMTLNYVNPTKYGIWLTLSSFIGWFSFFDIGLGNGLRNKLAEALANNDKFLARIYTSTTYAILGLIILPVMLIFIVLNPFLNWVAIFNTPPEMARELYHLMLVVFIFFSLKFVLQLFTTILYADQKPALSNFVNLLGNVFSLVLIFILTKTVQGSLFWLGTVLSVAPVLVLIIFSIYFFRNKYAEFSPSWKYVRFKYAKDLLNIGFQFFIISIAGIIIFSSTNMIITQLYGPEEVTPYNIAYKYFSTVTMVFTMAMTPFWSAFTDAFFRGEYDWIKAIMRKLTKVWVVIFVISIGMLLFSDIFYRLWIGKMVNVPFKLSLILFIYFSLNSFSVIFTSFLNGVGKIRLSLISAVIEAIIFIPAAIFLAKYMNLGVSGIVIASSLSALIGIIWMPFQYHKIINLKATGIWNK